MTIYLVRRYVDALPTQEYGVDDRYTLIGAFTEIAVANDVKAKAEAEIEAEKQAFCQEVSKKLAKAQRNWKKANTDKPFNRERIRKRLEKEAPPRSEIDILTIEVDKEYAVAEEPYLGGGMYME